jgi:hypothetical protein
LRIASPLFSLWRLRMENVALFKGGARRRI